MVQRKVPSKLGIQAEHVKSNMKLSSSQHQDGKSRGADMKKKMKKSRSIKLSDHKGLQSSSPSRRSFSQPGKPQPLHVPTTTASPQKHQPLVRTTYGSPNYMKPTSSSHAKKELFLVSHKNTQPGSDFKNLPRKFSCDSKDIYVSSKKPAKTLTRSSSLSLVRTLTKTTSFKASRTCPSKSTRAAICADMSAPQKATCSSTLKNSKFPQYLMLNPGGTESEGTSIMKVCPYTYCSLNGHHHSDLPPLKSFMSSRRRLLKTQKRIKIEALSPRRLKVPHETEKKDSDHEQNVFDAKPAYDEIGMDIFIEIYAKEKDAKPAEEAEEMGKIDFLEEIEGQEDNKSTIEDEDKVTLSITDTPSPLKSQIDLEEDLKNSFDDVATEVDTKGDFLQEQNAEDADEDHKSSLTHEEISMGSYCSDEEHMGDVDMDDSDAKAYDMEWEEEQFCRFDHEKDADSSVYTEEDNDSKVESLSESSHGVSVTWLDDIRSNYYEDILVDETLKEAKSEEGTYIEEESTVVQGQDLLEEDQGKAIKFQSTSCIGGEEKNTSKNWKGSIRRKRPIEDDDEMRNFNPREPNFLPLVPEPEPEKVDLRHQMVDDRKNADEWMLDRALRQVVTKLAPARKKKVALLVEAFETVMPIPKYENHTRNNSAFAHATRIQACS
ncbi:calmodulin binding protein PICBP-like [Gastrolobium bilobum]|uniref:calmodulin binding protein PICBP-like n=1 Tax=Gastrolobium bilobum TaxID=150636 RepID=UPI002AAFECEE|nr:calmodulin binding protein PICBP-like [Gastrolobium bilobum]XP_061357497.1 calmodulin binding protein PICBP-like [Gastrolobium bilobum]